MKIQVNPDLVKGHGGPLHGLRLFGKVVGSDDPQTVTADQWKTVKGLTATSRGRTLPMWVEVKPA